MADEEETPETVTWQPSRGPVFRFVAWSVLILIAVAILLMLFVIIKSA